jgi:hypothetical protein
VEPAKVPPPARASAAETALKKASGQYQGSDFRGAIATLTAAARPGPDGAELRTRAADYKTVGDGITMGKTAASSKPADALAALKRAVAADRRVGGAQADTLRQLIGKTAGQAAIAHMAKGSLEQAYAATVDASNYGDPNAPTVKSVRKSLEGKAAELYASAQRLKKSDPATAQKTLQRIRAIVPSSSMWHKKATAEIK